MTPSPTDPFDLAVTGTTPLAEDVLGFTLAHPLGDVLPEWAPGAHIEIELPGGLLRHYSLCGPVGRRGEWHIAVLREPKPGRISVPARRVSRDGLTPCVRTVDLPAGGQLMSLSVVS